MFDRNGKISALPWKIGAFFGLLFFILLLLVLTPEKVWADETPAGYDAFDYQKLLAFLELPNGTGKNGHLISAGYNPADPTTWEGVTWSSVGKVTRIDWPGKELVGDLDLNGCTALKFLYCNDNGLTSLDVSGCTSLQLLEGYNNGLSWLDASGCTSLKWLRCDANQLTSLDLTGCSALQELSCNNNQLSNLDVSGCTKLKDLFCFSNQLTSLDVGGCLALRKLNCSTNKLASLNLKGCTALESLSCEANELTSLDVSGFAVLKTLNCSSNKLASLNLKGCTALERLSCEANELTTLDVSGFSALQSLSCSSNRLTSLDLSGCTKLDTLTCSSNQLTSLDVSDCVALLKIQCFSNKLTSLDVSGCTALQTLSCDSNQLASLEVSGCTALQLLDCDSNQLTSLDLSGCKTLQTLYCHSNQLTSLNLDRCLVLQHLECYSNRLTFAHLPVSLPVAGGTYARSPQNPSPLGVGGKIVYNEEIDLSAEAWIKGVPTVFTWYKEIGGEFTPTTVDNGVFTFDESFAGQTIYCRMSNAQFKDLELETSKALVVSPPVAPQISIHPQDTTAAAGATAAFTIVAVAADADEGGELSYQWQWLADDGKTWIDLDGATGSKYTIPVVTFESDGHQFRCQVTNIKAGVSSKPIYSKTATLTVKTHQITFIKPTTANDVNNPVNINSGSLVLATIGGDLDAITSVTIKIDDNTEQIVTPSGDTIYHLLPANLSKGEHTITLKLTNAAGEVFEAAVAFHWDSYRRGFGFGRFDFGDAPAGE